MIKKEKKKYSRQDLKEVYSEIRKELGDASKTLKGLSDNGYTWFYNKVYKDFDSWISFKEYCGFMDKRSIENKSLYELREVLEDLFSIHGDDVLNTNWLKNNSLDYVHRQVTKNHGLSWEEFKYSLSFFKDTKGEFLSYDFESLDDIIKIYNEIASRNPDAYVGLKWLIKRKYGWLVQIILKNHNLTWHEFKKVVGVALYSKEILLNEIIEAYYEIKNILGEETISKKWMRKSEHRQLLKELNARGVDWLVFQEKIKVYQKQKEYIGISEHEFISKDMPKEFFSREYKILLNKDIKWKSKSRLLKNSYKWLVLGLEKNYEVKKWSNFAKSLLNEDTEIFTEDELLSKYGSILSQRKKVFLTKCWIVKNGYAFICDQAIDHYGLTWVEFNKKAHGLGLGFHTLTDKYKGICERYGSDAYSMTWMRKNKFGYIFENARSYYGLNWVEFKNKSGVIFEEITSLEELIVMYKSVREEYGDVAKSIDWMREHGFKNIANPVKNTYGLKWKDFKKLAGYGEDRIRSTDMKRFPLEKLTELYREAREEHGDVTKHRRFFKTKGLVDIPHQSKSHHKLNWLDFKKQAGYDDRVEGPRPLSDLIQDYKAIFKKHGDESLKTVWLTNNYPELKKDIGRHKLKHSEFLFKAGLKSRRYYGKLTIQELTSAYVKIFKEENFKSTSCSHLYENGHGWLYRQVQRENIPWKNFVKLCEGHFKIDKEDLMI